MAWTTHASSAELVSQGKATVKHSIEPAAAAHLSSRHRELPDSTKIRAATFLRCHVQYTFSRKTAQKLFHQRK